MKILKRILIAGGVLVLLTGLFVYFFGPPMVALLLLKQTPEEAPALYAVPEPMEVAGVCPAKATPLSYFGWTLTAPWEDIKERTVTESLAVLRSRSGPQIVLMAEKDKDRVDPLFWFRNLEMEADWLTLIWGNPVRDMGLRPYDDAETIFTATPESISLFMGPRAAVRLLILLPLKDMSLQGLGTPIRAFQTKSTRGFQFRDPGGPQYVSLLIYAEGGEQLHVMLGRPEGEGKPASQDEIKCMLRSLRNAVKEGESGA